MEEEEVLKAVAGEAGSTAQPGDGPQVTEAGGYMTLDDLAGEMPDREVAEWCTEWLLANAAPEAIADFVLCAMSQHEGLELLVRERSMGDDE